MSLHALERLAGAGVSRREMLGQLARWTVPTVITIALTARRASAAVSCPPCQKLVGGKCRSCTTREINNCLCEPCLGSPTCPAPGIVARPLGARSAEPGSAMQERLDPYLRLLQRRQSTFPDRPLGSPGNPLYRSPFTGSPFGPSRPYGGTAPGDSLRSRGLYERLRPDDPRRW